MKRKYCEKYDAYYGRFGKWLESACPDVNCEFCGERPKRHPRSCKCEGGW